MSKSVQAALQRQQAASQRPNTSISGASNFNRAAAGVAPAQQQRGLTGRLAGQGQQVQQQAAQQQYRQKMAAINAARQNAPTASLARGQPSQQQQQPQQRQFSGRQQPQPQQQQYQYHEGLQSMGGSGSTGGSGEDVEPGSVAQIPIDKAIALICLRLGKLEQGEIKRSRRELEMGADGSIAMGSGVGMGEGVATIDTETIEQIMSRLDKLDGSAAKMTDMQNRAEAARQLSLKTINSINELAKEMKDIKADLDEMGKIIRANDERICALEQAIMCCGDGDIMANGMCSEMGTRDCEQDMQIHDIDTTAVQEGEQLDGMEITDLNSEPLDGMDEMNEEDMGNYQSVPVQMEGQKLIPSNDPRDVVQHDDGLYRPTFSKVQTQK